MDLRHASEWIPPRNAWVARSRDVWANPINSPPYASTTLYLCGTHGTIQPRRRRVTKENRRGYHIVLTGFRFVSLRPPPRSEGRSGGCCRHPVGRSAGWSRQGQSSRQAWRRPSRNRSGRIVLATRYQPTRSFTSYMWADQQRRQRLFHRGVNKKTNLAAG